MTGDKPGSAARLAGSGWWELATALQFAALGVWMTAPASGLAIVAGLAAAGTLAVAAFDGSPLRVAVAMLGLAAAGAAFHTSWDVRRVENRWDAVRSSLVERAGARLDTTLDDAAALAGELAERGASEISQDEAFRRLPGGLAGRSPERGVAVFGGNGRPWAWAGTLRLKARPGRDGLRVRMTPYYVILEAQRTHGERVAVGHVLLQADSAIPNRDESVAARFRRATGVDLEFYPPASVPPGTDVFDYCPEGCPAGADLDHILFSVRPVPPTQGTAKLERLERGERRVAVALTLALALVMLVGSRWMLAFVVVGGGALVVATPLPARLGLGGFFSPNTYFLSPLPALPISAGTLFAFASVVLVLVAAGWRRPVRYRVGAVIPAALLVGGVPALVRYLVRGVTPPAAGVSVELWVGWVVSVATVLTVVGVAAAALARRSAPPRERGWTFWAALGWGGAVALLGLVIWRPGGWPGWYAVTWVPAFLLAMQPESRVRVVLASSAVAGMVAAVFTWGSVVEGRVILADRDVKRFAQGEDPFTQGYLERFGASLATGDIPRTAAELFLAWQRSPLSDNEYPALLITFGPGETEQGRLALARMDLQEGVIRILARLAREQGQPVIQQMRNQPGVYYVLSVPYPDGSVVTVTVGPRSRAIPPIRVARFLQGSRVPDAPYEMVLLPVQASPGAPRVRWVRVGSQVRGERAFAVPGGYRHLHVRVPLGSGIPNTLIRGALLVMLTMAIAGLLFGVGESLRRQLRLTTWAKALRRHSYRSRLLVALCLFFFLPTLGFGAWNLNHVGVEVDRTRDVIVRQTLQDAARAAIDLATLGGEESRRRLDALADQMEVDLLLYEAGQLVHSTAPVLSELGLVDPYLAPVLFRTLVLEDEVEATADRVLAGRRTRVGFRSLGGVGGGSLVLAAPRLADDRGFTDLYALLLATLLGFAAAVWLATRAVGSLSQPVRELSEAATALGRGEPVTFGPDMPVEFVPVVNAFERMESDVRTHQRALEEALTFTAAILSNVATGVLALDGTLRVTTANPRAVTLLGVEPAPERPIDEQTPAVWQALWDWVRAFAAEGREIDAEEFEVGERRIRVQVARLTTAGGGLVVALDDTTETAQASRVIAWGEMARQVAHEIKNPLTPIRLGVQHLQRVHQAQPERFDETLRKTADQILAEIERLDAIARAFSRFGAPPVGAAPLEDVDVADVARETVALYTMSEDARVTLTVGRHAPARLRRDELKEVLVNLIENARNAGADRIEMTVGSGDAPGRTRFVVRDNGSGIAAEDLSRIFEPRFSTTTSGTGLGLAICRRLVEAWGGTIRAESTPGEGTSIIFDVVSGT